MRDSEFPAAVLLVDRPAIRDLLLAQGAGERGLAVVCIDGTPAPVVAFLKRGFQEGRRVPVVYLHDAATVVFPFTLEPLATLVAQQEGGPVRYRDLGLPPLGATARRFGDPALPADQVILELTAIPPATLLRYAAEAASRLARGE